MSGERQLRLGPFELESIVGQGAMGAVWRGRHEGPGDVLVAVKVLDSALAARPGFAERFGREVRAQAALEHPNVARVFDQGVVPASLDRPALGLVPGLPYLVLELGQWGTLADLQGRIGWADLREILLSLLDALAHVHARGLVHADLKPQNVLAELDGTVKLTDFGLAAALDAIQHEGRAAVGTPMYMAPEQVLGRARDMGPWTDLYALGGVAWALACGDGPFGAERRVPELLELQLRAAPPAFAPCDEVPRGFEPWLRQLLRKNPARRFRQAADAARALWSLDSAERRPSNPRRLLAGRTVLPSRPGRSRRSEPTTSIGVFSHSEHFGEEVELDEARIVPLDAVPGPPSDRAPVPEQWREPGPEQRGPAHLGGVGLALYGVRRVPMVGRSAERDALWQALRGAGASGRVRVVVLTGPSGVGKSRLARWLCERAHEVGAATWLSATCSPAPGPSDGLAAMARRRLRCEGLERPGLAARLERLLAARRTTVPPGEVDALTELLCPDGPTDAEAAVHFGSPAERFAPLLRVLAEQATERPVIAWLDDVQWGLEALHFVSHLLRLDPAELPLLFVLTVRDDLLSEFSLQARLLEALSGLERVTWIPVEPLGPVHSADLVRGLLGLEPTLAARVEERAAGNALFSVQLVGDWVQRGLLVPRRDGFALVDGADPELPDDIHAVWARRLARVAIDRPPRDLLALELAATLGQEIDDSEWRQLCDRATVPPAAGLVDHLVAWGLAHQDPRSSSWGFAHAMLRESLARRAREGGRWETHNRHCARLLGEGRGAGVAERLAGHLMAAGEPGEALGPLRRACRERDLAGDARGATALSRRYRRCLEELGAGPDDPRTLWTRLREVSYARSEGDFDRGLELGRELLADTIRVGCDPIRCDALREVGHLLEHKANLVDATARFRQSTALAARLGDRGRMAASIWLLGQALWKQGLHSQADDEIQRATRLFRGEGDHHGLARGQVSAATIARQRGHLDRARLQARLALDVAGPRGYRSVAAKAWNVVGEVERLRGDLRAAESAYREAQGLYRAVGSRFGLAPALNLGLVLVELGRIDDARRQLEEALERSRRLGMAGSTLGALISLLLCDAHDADWISWDLRLDEARGLLARTGFIEEDCPVLLTRAGRIAIDAGQRDRASVALRVAADRWRALGRPERAASVEALLAG